VVKPRLVTGDDAVQETVTFSFVVIQQLLIDLHSVVFTFLCEHPRDPPATNFVILQRCQHRFRHTESDIQLRTQFPRRNPLIRTDGLVEALNISWLTAVQGRSELGLSLISLSPLLKRTTHGLAVLKSTVWSP
jgi:hypothetical protein